MASQFSRLSIARLSLSLCGTPQRGETAALEASRGLFRTERVRKLVVNLLFEPLRLVGNAVDVRVIPSKNSSGQLADRQLADRDRDADSGVWGGELIDSSLFLHTSLCYGMLSSFVTAGCEKPSNTTDISPFFSLPVPDMADALRASSIWGRVIE